MVVCQALNYGFSFGPFSLVAVCAALFRLSDYYWLFYRNYRKSRGVLPFHLQVPAGSEYHIALPKPEGLGGEISGSIPNSVSRAETQGPQSFLVAGYQIDTF